MPITYDRIATTTVGTATSSVTFSSIPATYTDLVLITSSTNDSGTSPSNITFRFNSDTTTNYSNTFISGSGTTATSGRLTSVAFGIGALITSSEIANSTWQIFNYTNTTTFKTVLARGNIAGAFIRQCVFLWRKTPEAITSILLKNNTAQNFAVGCTFTLYGIKAA
jgi:hypothetical protein